MASSATRLKDKKEKLEMNPTNVADQEQEDKSEGLPENTWKVSRTVKVNGEDVKKEATLHVPFAKDFNDMNKMSGNDEQEAVYWFNLARKLTAQRQVFAALGNTYADETINELSKGYEAALEQMLQGSKDPAKVERYQKFILSEDQFAPLVEAMKTVKDSKEVPHFDFGSKYEIKKPGDQRGPKPKDKK